MAVNEQSSGQQPQHQMPDGSMMKDSDMKGSESTTNSSESTTNSSEEMSYFDKVIRGASIQYQQAKDLRDNLVKGANSGVNRVTSFSGMGSESITDSVATSAATANATTSNLTYIPSKLDTTNDISSNSISTNDMPAGAVMQADTVMINTQRTVALREQGLDTQQAVAMAPMIFQSKSSSNVTNNVSTTKPMMMPVPVSNTGDGGFNFSNG